MKRIFAFIIILLMSMQAVACVNSPAVNTGVGVPTPESPEDTPNFQPVETPVETPAASVSVPETEPESEIESNTETKVETPAPEPYPAPIPIALPEIKDTDNYPTISNKLSWEAICSFPIKSADMSVDELRALCVDFFRYTKTALWIPDKDISYTSTAGGKTDQMNKGQIYGGLPYITTSSGNIYRLLDYMDPETGVVNMSEAAQNVKLFGNQCSIGAYWGWGRVINSANYQWTANMVHANGFLRLGNYTYGEYSDSITAFSTTKTTTKICQSNGKQTMFEAYALLQPADGLVYYTTAGHVIMCSSKAEVVYKEDGSIDGNKSYIYMIDQATKWVDMKNEDGDSFKSKSSVDVKMTFEKLYSGSYLPFTFKEFLGTDPVEDTECEFLYSGSEITLTKLCFSKIKANYGIADAYAILRDKDGNVVDIAVTRAEKANVMSLSFASAIDTSEWKNHAGKGYTVEVVCQLSTGERPLIYKGVLIAG